MNALSLGFSSIGRRLAAISGALVAMTSLLVDAPVWVATARGGCTTLAILLVVRTAGGYLGRSSSRA